MIYIENHTIICRLTWTQLIKYMHNSLKKIKTQNRTIYSTLHQIWAPRALTRYSVSIAVFYKRSFTVSPNNLFLLGIRTVEALIKILDCIINSLEICCLTTRFNGNVGIDTHLIENLPENFSRWFSRKIQFPCTSGQSSLLSLDERGWVRNQKRWIVPVQTACIFRIAALISVIMRLYDAITHIKRFSELSRIDLFPCSSDKGNRRCLLLLLIYKQRFTHGFSWFNSYHITSMCCKWYT